MVARITPMLVFTVSYLAIFFLLMGIMPVLAPNLLYGGKTYSSFNVPDYFSTWDLENIKYFEENNITFPTTAIYYDYNPDIDVKIYAQWLTLHPYIHLELITWEWLIFWESKPMVFYDLNKTTIIDEMYLAKSHLLSEWDSDFNASIFTAEPYRDKIIKVKCWFSDTNNTRNDIGEAWDEGKVYLGIGFGMDDVETSYNAFNLIAVLLTFQQPQIFGATGILAITLNLIINSPIYLAIVYLVFYFITSIIPFIRGA